jgi:hypothetical protein
MSDYYAEKVTNYISVMSSLTVENQRKLQELLEHNKEQGRRQARNYIKAIVVQELYSIEQNNDAQPGSWGHMKKLGKIFALKSVIKSINKMKGNTTWLTSK